MILITGAAGKTGRAIVRALCKRGVQIRAVVHREEQIRQLKQLGVQSVVCGDMRSQPMMNQAATGVRAIYHICPNVSPDELTIGQIMIRAAQFAGVERFVYHSVFHPQIESMPHHWQKMRVEEKLFESGLSCTILQPAPYMQNILPYWEAIVEHGRFRVPYSEHTQLSSVDLEDVAEVAATVLCESGHEGAIYELCGTEPLSPVDIARIISRCLGKQITVQVISHEEWEATAREKGLGEYQIQALLKMFRYYEQFGYCGNSRILECLLKRSPTTYVSFIERTVRETTRGRRVDGTAE